MNVLNKQLIPLQSKNMKPEAEYILDSQHSSG